ncbi:Rossmann-fold NAD(P)-binding domain-containing protein [Pseudooceanicola sp. 502str34]
MPHALVIGASGKFGRHATAALAAEGWQITRFDRARDDLAQAMAGKQIVVMAANPPSYHLWARQLMPLHGAVARAARAADLPVLLPGNVYVYGPDSPMPWGPDSPQRATNPLGQLRIDLEQMYRDTCRTIVLTMGDFLDEAPTGGWFDRIIAARLDRGVLRYPGALDVPHAWAWLKDAGRAAAGLAAIRNDLPAFQKVTMPGYTLSAAEMATLLTAARGQPVRATRMPWLPLRLAAPAVPFLRGLVEMRYLWSLPHRLDGTTFDRLLPDFAPTPPQAALAEASAHVPGGLTPRPAPLPAR